jgi:hypothetical protein
VSRRAVGGCPAGGRKAGSTGERRLERSRCKAANGKSAAPSNEHHERAVRPALVRSGQKKRMALTMANLNSPVREDPSESTAPTLRSPKGEQDREATSKAEMGESLKCGGDSNPSSPGDYGSPPRLASHHAPAMRESWVWMLPTLHCLPPASQRLGDGMWRVLPHPCSEVRHRQRHSFFWPLRTNAGLTARS